MPDMKPNPCKWCGKEPTLVNKLQRVYPECNCPHADYYQFVTWQKNNPLPEKKEFCTYCGSISHLKDKCPFAKPHQFKVGDWVKVENHGGKYQIDEIGTGEYHVHNKSDQRKWVLEVELTPATRLKRKEIRKRLQDITEICVEMEDYDRLLKQLIEEI